VSIEKKMMKGWETIWTAISTRTDGLYKEKKGDNVNTVCLYIQDNAVISFAEVMVI